jgi:hypothetical protein
VTDLRHLFGIYRRGCVFTVSRKELKGWELVCFHAGSETQAKACAERMAEDYPTRSPR